MSPYQSPDLKHRTVDVERIGADCFIRGFAIGILTLAVLLAFFDCVAR